MREKREKRGSERERGKWESSDIKNIERETKERGEKRKTFIKLLITSWYAFVWIIWKLKMLFKQNTEWFFFHNFILVFVVNPSNRICPHFCGLPCIVKKKNKKKPFSLFLQQWSMLLFHSSDLANNLWRLITKMTGILCVSNIYIQGEWNLNSKHPHPQDYFKITSQYIN